MKDTQVNVAVPPPELSISSFSDNKKGEEGCDVTLDSFINSTKEEMRDEGTIEGRLSDNKDRENCDENSVAARTSDGSPDEREEDENGKEEEAVQNIGEVMVQSLASTIELVRSLSSTLSFTSTISTKQLKTDTAKVSKDNPEEIKEHEDEQDDVPNIGSGVSFAASVSTVSFGSTTMMNDAKEEKEPTCTSPDPETYNEIEEGNGDVQDLNEGIETVPSVTSAHSFGSILSNAKKD